MKKTALVTGSAKRIGAEIIRTLHAQNYVVIIHYKSSKNQANMLARQLNLIRKDSARAIYADLAKLDDIKNLATQISHLNLLVNNASRFYSTPFEKATITDWHELINHNLTSAFFLTQALHTLLKKTQGSVINLIDIHAERPLKNYNIYNITKAGMAMMTKSLAKELAPDIRVNGIAPGSILLPSEKQEQFEQQKILEKIALKKQGVPQDIANALYFLANAPYITGQILTIDGGRTLNQ